MGEITDQIAPVHLGTVLMPAFLVLAFLVPEKPASVAETQAGPGGPPTWTLARSRQLCVAFLTSAPSTRPRGRMTQVR